MAYIQRDTTGSISAIFETAQADAQEEIALDDPELIQYLTQDASDNSAKSVLAVSDVNLIRVLEDLINTLIDKKVILFTDLPLAAREKLVTREKVRGHLTSLDDLIDDGGSIL